MNDADDKAFLAICQEVPAILALRLEAVALAPGLNGDAEKIAKVWRARGGLQSRISDALAPLGLVHAAMANQYYDAVCKEVFAKLWAGKS